MGDSAIGVRVKAEAGVVSLVGVGSVLFSIVKLLGWATGVRVNAEVGVVSCVGVGTK